MSVYGIVTGETMEGLITENLIKQGILFSQPIKEVEVNDEFCGGSILKMYEGQDRYYFLVKHKTWENCNYGEEIMVSKDVRPEDAIKIAKFMHLLHIYSEVGPTDYENYLKDYFTEESNDFINCMNTTEYVDRLEKCYEDVKMLELAADDLYDITKKELKVHSHAEKALLELELNGIKLSDCEWTDEGYKCNFNVNYRYKYSL